MSARVHFLRDAALAFVAAHDSGRHAHRALQLTLALDVPFRFEPRDGEWREAAFAAFAPGEPHRIVSGAGRVAYLFIDRGPRAHAAWRAAGHVPIAPDADLQARLRQAAGGSCEPIAAAALAADWERCSLAGANERAARTDARIDAALAAIERDPAEPTNHRRLAAAAHLSTSRFAERFRAVTGMPVRNYLLWRRLLHAVELLQRGDSATQAAHAAGFADAAHLSRSFRRILGVSPSELLSP